ncbi:hypothetical protein PINS_up001985 [Pythium insidiosum]|nr:hypothetical protein PINS_up001985 [Pythium insidiosum]
MNATSLSPSSSGRHHCRMCGNSFCHEHSSRRVTLLGIGFDDEPVRVCDACFADYHAQASGDYFHAPTPSGMHAPHYPAPSPYGPQPSPASSYYYTPRRHGPGMHPHAPPPHSHGQPRYPPPYYGSVAPPPASTHTSAA